MSMCQFMSLEGREISSAPDSNPIPESDNTFLELQEVNQGADGYLAMVEETQTTAQTLGAIAEHVEEALPEGGLSAPVAVALTAAIEHFKSRLSSKRTVVSAVALEGFANGNRLGATHAALEGIKDFLASIWAAIVKAFKTAWEWISKVFQAVFGGRKALAKKAAEVKAREEECKRAHRKEDFDKAVKAAQEAQAAYSKKTEDQLDEMLRQMEEELTRMREADAQKAKEQSDVGVKAAKHIVAFLTKQNELIRYFRKSPTEVFSAAEIAKRTKASRESLSFMLTNEAGGGLPAILNTLDRNIQYLSRYKKGDDTFSTDGGNNSARVDRIREILNLGAQYRKVSKAEEDKITGGDDRYIVYKAELAFNEDLYVCMLDELQGATPNDIAKQKAIPHPKPALTIDNPKLEIASPEFSEEMNNYIVQLAKSTLGDQMKTVERKLAELLDKGEHVKAIINEIEDEQERNKTARRLQVLMMQTQSTVIAVLAMCKFAEGYELRLLNHVLEYSDRSNTVLQIILEDMDDGK